MEGDNSAYGYCKTVSEHGKEMLKVSPHLTYCSSGPYPNEEWVEHAAKPLGSMAPLISIHAYPLYPDYIDPAKRKEEYYHCIDGVDFWARMKLIKTRKLLKNDDIRISLDEWNTWYAWYRPGSVTDGIFTAYMLHMIIDESDKLGVDVACHFEAVNESAIRVETDRSFLTPTGQMFTIMKHHANGMLCASGQDVIATEKEGVLTVTLLNRAFDENKKFILPACGKVLTSQLYTAEDVVPGTEFAVSDMALQEAKGLYEITLPKHSVMFLQLETKKV
jgi:alpha-L-arabinofuranosidase